MFVPDSRIFPSPKMKVSLTISCLGGEVVTMDIDPELTVDKVKITILQQLDLGVLGGDTASRPMASSSHDRDAVKNSIYQKLVHVSSCKSLADEKSLKDQGVQDNDELILVNRRLPAPASFKSLSKNEESNQAPTAEMIKQSTQGLPSMHADRTPGSQPNVDNLTLPTAQISPRIHRAVFKDEIVSFQKELRKILISLIEVAQKLLCLNPEAAKIFTEAEELMEKENSSAEVASASRVDSGALSQLMDMGFPENRATKALLITRMSVMEAMEWLLLHENDLDLDEPLSEVTSIQDHNDNDQVVGAAVSGDLDEQTTETPASSQASSKVSNILKSFKAFKRKEFKPNQKAFQMLREMGFAETDVIDALRINGNREKAACDWLLSGERNDITVDESGLDPEGSLYKAIMSNHIVQLGLTNPRSLVAFLNMLENPNNTQQWLTDQDTGPMLIQISRIYYSERNVS